ncbi:MAG: lysophospholipid acyltransferase family protein [Paramuribaculum sp.]|nr:lysophospholipid acyltransferase family protein [Paramuribaculum sp.]
MKFSEKLTYLTLSIVCGALSLLPLGLLYILSDILAFTARYIVRYRVKIVMSNLSSSFPDKSEKELKAIARKFYQFLCDYFVETIKLYSMSQRYIRKHLTVEGIELLDNAMKNGRNCSLMLGHYCNWEWISSLPVFLAGYGAPIQVYHPLRNAGSDKFFDRLRIRFNAENVAQLDIFKTLMKYRREGTPTVVGYIADQVPSMNIHLFVDFLNHDTPVFTGPERISRILDADVYFGHMTRPRRGYYRLRIIPITQNIKGDPTFEPTKEYFRLLEENIKEAPQYWLWSHRRWKRTRERFYQVFGDKAEEQLSHL